MRWLKSSRESDLERLVEVQQKQIDELSRKKNPSGQFVVVNVPQRNDMRTYHEKISALVTDPFYLFYITQLRRSIVDDFEVGKESPDIYRGKLSLLGNIINDARMAANQLGTPQEEVTDAV
jgi:hypothetical protein